MFIFDAQVNLGKDRFGPDCDVELYLASVRSEINKMLFIPVPTHSWALVEGATENSCLWRIKNGIVEYYSELFDDRFQLKTVIFNPTNPYKKFNDYVIRTVKTLALKHPIKKFYCAVKIHPKLDQEEIVDEYLTHDVVKAFKIHGIATFSKPEDVPNWLIRKSLLHDIPFFVHTDYFHADEDEKIVYGADIIYVMNENTSRAWLDWAQKNNVRIFLAHGACLDPKVIQEVNALEGCALGTGPESAINFERTRLHLKNTDYLETLLRLANPSKIIYCSDYRWNTFDRDSWNRLDWDDNLRLKEKSQSLGFSTSEISCMLYENACSFFNCL